jgi:FPC/CPF motif-containing protein YcgG
MSQYYFKKSEINDIFQPYTWESTVFKEFETTLTSKTRPFPCIFGVAGFQQDQLRYSFSEKLTAPDIASSLENFVKNSREYGQNTSLVVFSRPRPMENIKSYEERFWSLISDLASIDKYEWPEKIPRTLDSPLWEFCFAGEPIFVVCNTPAHVLRQSRRASCFMITFQPRWVFDGILGTPELAKKSFEKVRSRLKPFDLISPSPHLGSYGNPDNREFSQYFLREDNEPVSCPFHQLPEKSSNKKDVA